MHELRSTYDLVCFSSLHVGGVLRLCKYLISCLRAKLPVSNIQSPALVVCAIGGAADLAVALHARQPSFDVQFPIGWCPQITRGHILQHHVHQTVHKNVNNTCRGDRVRPHGVEQESLMANGGVSICKASSLLQIFHPNTLYRDADARCCCLF